MDYHRKVVIVTGSSSGIGAATAKLFAKHGALVTIVGRDETRLLEVAKSCEKASGTRPLHLLLDLTTEGACEEIVKKTVEIYGKIDVLVNSAGKLVMTSLFDNTMEMFDELIAVNLRVPYKITQLCTPHLKETKGSVINVFAAPMRSTPGLLVSSMIRDALERFTKAAASELASVGVRMNAVRPGLTRTNLLRDVNLTADCVQHVYDRMAKSVPTQVIIEPDEVARMILFAASNVCPNLTGCNLTVDGAASS